MAVTLKGIAGMLQVSPATVSLALNGSPLVAEETRSRILALAEQLDYVPNNFGRGLQSKRSRLLGYLTGTATISFWGAILESVGREAARHGYGLLTGWNSGEDGRSPDAQLQLLLEKHIDGLLVSLSAETMRPYLAKLRKRGVPVLFCSGDAVRDVAYVRTDYFQGGVLAAKHLLELGHRNLLCCRREPERRDGNLAAAEKYPDAHVVGFDLDDDILKVLEQHPEITAIIAYSDDHAVNLMYRLRHAGFQVPEDLSVVGFDGSWFAERPEFNLTTIVQRQQDLGRDAVCALLNMIERNKTTEQRMLAPELVVRSTTAAPRR